MTAEPKLEQHGPAAATAVKAPAARALRSPKAKTGQTKSTGTKAPTLRYERTFAAAGHRVLAGCDEVGRGALAGPVSVGLVAVQLGTVRSLKGVKDSKLLSAADREAMAPLIKKWCPAWGVGHASRSEERRVGKECPV